MPSSPRHYACPPGTRLYTDHQGRRIVGDWEGGGTLHVQLTGGTAWLESEQSPLELQDGHTLAFESYGLVVADESASVTLEYEAGMDAQSYARAEWRVIDAFDIADLEALKARQWRVQNISERFPLESTFPDGTSLIGTTASHLNAAHWTLAWNGEPEARLVIRKVYDRFHGRQRARVLIDGRLAGMWYEPVEDREHRWGAGEFVIAEPLPPGPITITIDPPSGTPLWNVGRLEMFALRLPA